MYTTSVERAGCCLDVAHALSFCAALHALPQCCTRVPIWLAWTPCGRSSRLGATLMQSQWTASLSRRHAALGAGAAFMFGTHCPCTPLPCCLARPQFALRSALTPPAGGVSAAAQPALHRGGQAPDVHPAEGCGSECRGASHRQGNHRHVWGPRRACVLGPLLERHVGAWPPQQGTWLTCPPLPRPVCSAALCGGAVQGGGNCESAAGLKHRPNMWWVVAMPLGTSFAKCCTSRLLALGRFQPVLAVISSCLRSVEGDTACSHRRCATSPLLACRHQRARATGGPAGPQHAAAPGGQPWLGPLG